MELFIAQPFCRCNDTVNVWLFLGLSSDCLASMGMNYVHSIISDEEAREHYEKNPTQCGSRRRIGSAGNRRSRSACTRGAHTRWAGGGHTVCTGAGGGRVSRRRRHDQRFARGGRHDRVHSGHSRPAGSVCTGAQRRDCMAQRRARRREHQTAIQRHLSDRAGVPTGNRHDRKRVSEPAVVECA